MKVAGSAVLGADRDRVWTALQDPAVLVRTIPGCERLEETGPDTYRMTVTAGVASIRGLYQGEVALRDPDAPGRFVLRARGQGAPGTVEATVEVRLSETDGGTRVDYDAEAVVGGMIGGVGQRVLGTVARRTAAEFFAAVERHLASGGAAPPSAVSPAVSPAAAPAVVRAPDAAAVPGAGDSGPAVPEGARPVRVFQRTAAPQGPPQGPPQGQGVPVWTVVTAFGMGAGVALGSAVIGWLLGRAGRRG
ncbi:carbon monoxide dehydrogenase subunit G [Planomonospora sp. ID82291]|uniref:SRPBCC family protein n=1 Tax=Planomonospora sp. ID82291 TaxID=2738136 RepID=UPI0018C42561|nr:carbon monoxide dehydrogenase subunit G [Planomonospora sp. ID82291]MBG0818029.1 carbon monoxide dehydrogenase subunit G [Planomonospora sp. ID82291]